jgi:HSP20 family protein
MKARSLLPSLWHKDESGDPPFLALHHEINRVFDDFRRGVPWAGFGIPNGGARFAPLMDVVETDKAIEIDAELPGMTEKDIDVSVVDNVLTVKGEKKEEKEEKDTDYHMVERSYGAFTRSLMLPYEVDASKVEAKFDKGVLKITLPKPAEVKAKTKKIKIKSAA